MKSFKQWLEDADDVCGIYPPGYEGIGNYPPGYWVNAHPYITASLKNAKKDKKKHKKDQAEKDLDKKLPS